MAVRTDRRREMVTRDYFAVVVLRGTSVQDRPQSLERCIIVCFLSKVARGQQSRLSVRRARQASPRSPGIRPQAPAPDLPRG